MPVSGPLSFGTKVAYGSEQIAEGLKNGALAAGRRQEEGIFFAASSFSAKVPVGLGTIIAGFGLELIDWPSGAHIRSAAHVPLATIPHLGILFGPFVAGFGLVCVWCYSHYDLSRARHDEILVELGRRRELPAPGLAAGDPAGGGAVRPSARERHA